MRSNTEAPRVALYEEVEPYVKYENNCVEASTKAIMAKLDKVEGFKKVMNVTPYTLANTDIETMVQSMKKDHCHHFFQKFLSN